MYIHEYHIIDSVLVDIRNKNSNLEASRTKIAKMRSKENRGIDRYLAYNRRIKLLFWSINTNIQKIIPEESHHIVYSITKWTKPNKKVPTFNKETYPKISLAFLYNSPAAATLWASFPIPTAWAPWDSKFIWILSALYLKLKQILRDYKQRIWLYDQEPTL